MASPDNASQTPYSWTFEGSNDGSSCTTLDTRTAQAVAFGYGLHVQQRDHLHVLPDQRLGGAVRATWPSPAWRLHGAPTRTNHSGSSGEAWIVRKGPASGNVAGPNQTGTGSESYMPLSDGKVYYQIGSSQPRRQHHDVARGHLERMAHHAHGQEVDRRHGAVGRRRPEALVEHGRSVMGDGHVSRRVELSARPR